MTPFEDFRHEFSEIYFGVADHLNLDPELAVEEEPTISRNAMDNPTGLRYDIMNNEIAVDMAKLDFDLSDKKAVAMTAGSLSANAIRDFFGSGDEIPRWKPEKKFFSRLAADYALEKYAGEEKPEIPDVNFTIEIPENMSPDEAIDFISRSPEERPRLNDVFEAKMQESWHEISTAVGGQAARDEYKKAISDENLIYWPSMKIREEYGIDERLRDVLKENSERYTV